MVCIYVKILDGKIQKCDQLSHSNRQTFYLVFRSNGLGLLGGEAAALDEGVDVGTILHQHVIVHRLNQTPELLLDGLWRNHL